VRVAILCPTHNRAGTIGEAIESCLRQSAEWWDLFVLDDGTEDETEAVVRSFADPRIHYRRPPKAPGNEPAVRNALLAWWPETHAFACWLDSDDVLHPERVARQSAYMSAHPEVDVSFTDLGVFTAREAIWPLLREGATIFPRWPLDISRYAEGWPRGYRGNVNHPTAMFRVRDVPYDSRVVHGGCDVLWIMALRRAGRRLGYLADQLYYLRQWEGRLTKRRDALPQDVLTDEVAMIRRAVAELVV